MANLFSLQTIIKLIIAIMLDVMGVFCSAIGFFGFPGAFIGAVLSQIPDAIGFVVIGGLDRKKNKKFYLTFVAEVCPWLGALPWWTAYVLFGNKQKNEE